MAQQDDNLTQTAVLNQAAQAEQVTRMAEHLQDGSQLFLHKSIFDGEKMVKKKETGRIVEGGSE